MPSTKGGKDSHEPEDGTNEGGDTGTNEEPVDISIDVAYAWEM
jgi:hypothetical protein